MNLRIIGLILTGFGIGALLKDLLTDGDKKDVKDSGDRGSGSDPGKQDSAVATNNGRDRVVINNIYTRPKKKKPAAQMDKEVKNDQPSDINPKVNPE